LKLEMHKNSLFAILLRSPWWISLAVAGALFAGLRMVVPALYAGMFAVPFLAIGCIAAWKQLRAPSRASIEERLAAMRALDWKAFSELLEQHFRKSGYEVARLQGEDADLELTRGGRRSLVACKRWKVARTGVEPLRQLKAAARRQRADECMIVVAGELTEGAASFAAQEQIRILAGAELAEITK
jgi:restriction system protein